MTETPKLIAVFTASFLRTVPTARLAPPVGMAVIAATVSEAKSTTEAAKFAMAQPVLAAVEVAIPILTELKIFSIA